MAAVVARAVEEPEGGGEKEKEEEENKRRRTNHVLDYATQQDAQELREKYTNAKPFPHAVIENVAPRELLVRVRDELINSLEAQLKETDLFKVYQTCDLNSLDASDDDTRSRMNATLQLRSMIQSKEFISFVEKSTECGELGTTVDCSVNVYAHRGHLLCHDDVIGTRAVSFIIYLTRPDLAWRRDIDGGNLELFSVDEEGEPFTTPDVLLEPDFNRMVLFSVVPGVSYHAVGEVTSRAQPRLSISGWFHHKEKKAAAESAAAPSSRQQLLSVTEAACEIGDPLPSLPGYVTDDDIAFLGTWIQAEYLTKDVISHLRDQFEAEACLHLHGFLRPERAEKIRTARIRASQYDSKTVRDDWKVVGPPHKQRFARYDGHVARETCANGDNDVSGSAEEEYTVGALLKQCLEVLLQSDPMRRWLSTLTGMDFTHGGGSCRRFSRGFGYTISHEASSVPRLDCVLCFVDDDGGDGGGDGGDGSGRSENGGANGNPSHRDGRNGNGGGENTGSKDKGKVTAKCGCEKGKEKEENAEDCVVEDDDSAMDKKELWGLGSVGGFQCYVTSDENDQEEENGCGEGKDMNGDAIDEDVAVYRPDVSGGSGVLNVPAINNALSIVLCEPGIMDFVKYVSNDAPSERYDVRYELAVLAEEVGDDEEEDEED